MTERRAMERFETRFVGRVRAYTDRATERRIDALAISRTAMSSGRATGWSPRRLGAASLGRGVAGVDWAVAFVVVVLIGAVSVAVLGRPSDPAIGPLPTTSISSTPGPATSPGGPIPDVLRHSWQRPYAVTPGLDQWGSGFLSLASGALEFRPEPGAPASTSVIAAAGLDTLVATATAGTQGCAIGDIGAYRWSLEGKGTVLTLTATTTDACAAREESLAGQWVRSDLPPPGDGVTLPPGTHLTSAFEPFGESGLSGQLSYSVPAGWKVKLDQPEAFVLNHLPDTSPSEPIAGMFVEVFVLPRIAADFAEGEMCGLIFAAPGVGRGIDDIVAAITARPGVVSTPPAAVTIGGSEGRMLDIHLAQAWTGGCKGPEGTVVAVPILVPEGSGPVAAVSRDHPLRLILLDLGGERTIAISIYSFEPIQPSRFDEQVADVMPVIESFEFHPPTP